jgi:hypothetical protein
VHVVVVVDEEGALAAVEPAAVDDQRLVAVVQRRPLDRPLRKVELGMRSAIRSSGSRRSSSRSFIVVIVVSILAVASAVTSAASRACHRPPLPFPSKRRPVVDLLAVGAEHAENLARFVPVDALGAVAKRAAASVAASGATDDRQVVAIGVLRRLFSSAA